MLSTNCLGQNSPGLVTAFDFEVNVRFFGDYRPALIPIL